MTRVDAHMAVVESQLGYKEPGSGVTKYGAWFADAVNSSTYRAGDWCAMFQLWCANESGLLAEFGGANKAWAYVPSWWLHFKALGVTGKTPRKGALIFYDFNRTGDPEHVGICRGTSGTAVLATEGNTGNAVLHRTRSKADILGFAYPDYPAAVAVDNSCWMG